MLDWSDWTVFDVNDAIHKTLADVSDFLRAHEVPFAVIGGIAVAARGEPRFTADVDIVAGIDVNRCLELLGTIEQTSFRPLFADVAEVVEKAFLLPLQHRQTKVRVDLAVGMTGFERQAIARATDVQFAGCSLPVVSAEDLILMKSLAGRPRDTDDMTRIVQRQSELLDWDYLLKLAAELQEALGHEIVRPLLKLRDSQV